MGINYYYINLKAVIILTDFNVVYILQGMVLFTVYTKLELVLGKQYNLSYYLLTLYKL